MDLRFKFLFVGVVFWGSAMAWASNPPVRVKKLSDQLTDIRSRVIQLQQNILENAQSEKQATSNYKKVQLLLKLQKTEREIARRRMDELEKTVAELETRRKSLQSKIQEQQTGLRKLLLALDRSAHVQNLNSATQFGVPDQERLEAPRRRVLSHLVDRGLKEVEELRVDVQDSEKLASRIQEERGQLAYLLQEVQEQEGVLELNQQLQADFLKRTQKERLSQLESYRRLKQSESRVEQMISDFNARKELEKAVEAEKEMNRTLGSGAFAQSRGHLKFPVIGAKVISGFGRTYDSRSKLQIFKKGIDLAGGKNLPVFAVYAGKVAYSGTLPDYGTVVIIDHGDHFYTLSARLGDLNKKTGDSVTAGEVIGKIDNSGTPIYFEIRSRNVAVNPLQWISN